MYSTMPALTLSDAIFNPQVQSKFFILSLELRQAIYSYLVPHGIHINIRPGIFSVSVCVQSCPNDSSYGEERRWRLTPYTVSDTVYPRRLRSSWVSGAWTGCDPALTMFLLVHIGSSLGMRRDCPWNEPHCRGIEGHPHGFYAHVQEDVCLCNIPDCIRSYHDTGVQTWWTFS